MQWHIISKGVQRGPVEEAELRRLAREGSLHPDDYVWNETLGEQWARASSVEGLFGQPPPVPPAVPPTMPRTPLVAGSCAPSDRISCTDPVGMAWERMKLILFAPFDLGKWFTLGVSAWLATFGEGGGSFNIPDFGRHAGRGGREFEHAIREAITWIKLHLWLVCGIGAVVILLSVALGLLFMWLRCRGKFMFLDNVVNNRTEVAAPWKAFARQGNSLFKWSLVYGVVCLIIVLLLVAAVVWGVVIPCVVTHSFVKATVPGIVAIAVLLLALAVVAGYISRFLEDFIVPIMYRQGVTATEAWRRFMPVLKGNFWTLVLYGLFYLVLALAAGMAVLLCIIVTCCIAGCLMLIPYVGAVVLLPVTVFFRLYSIEYLAQFGQEFDARSGGGGSGGGRQGVHGEPLPTTADGLS